MSYVIEINKLIVDANEAATFDTIDDLIAKHESCIIRLLCVLYPWSTILHLTDNEGEYANDCYRKIKKFIINTRNFLNSARNLKFMDDFAVLNEYNIKMNKQFSEIKKNINIALCNNIDLSDAMKQIMILITSTTEYIDGDHIHAKLIENIYDFIINLLTIFGFKSEDLFSS